MPIMDVLTKFCENEGIDGSTGTALIGSQIDLGEEHRDIGAGRIVYCNIAVTEAFVGSGASVNLQIVSDAAAAIATNGTATLHIATGVLGVAAFPLGKQFTLPLPIEGNVYERYLGLLAVISGAAVTAGAITAFLSPDPIGSWQAYPALT